MLGLKNHQLSQAGDTIVEVLIALAVLGLAFSISYATATHSLQMARNSQEHSEALQYLDSQVELLRAVSATNPAVFDTANTFCMDSSGNKVNYPVGLPVSLASAPASCIVTGYGTYITVTYSNSQLAPISGVHQGIFTITAQWQGVGQLGNQQEQLSYKLCKPGSSTC